MTLTIILVWLITGLVIGGLARLLVPGRQRIGIGLTLLIGIAGALLGGIVTAAILGPGHVVITFIVALIVAALLISATTHRGHVRRRSYGRYRRRRPRWLRW